MASKTVPKVDSRDPAVQILQEIAVLAHATDRQAYYLPSGTDGEEMELFADRLRESVCKMGWLAERALCELGITGTLVREGVADNWLMPPACRSAKEVSHG